MRGGYLILFCFIVIFWLCCTACGILGSRDSLTRDQAWNFCIGNMDSEQLDCQGTFVGYPVNTEQQRVQLLEQNFYY